MPDSYTIGDVTYLKVPGQVSEIKSIYYNDQVIIRIQLLIIIQIIQQIMMSL